MAHRPACRCGHVAEIHRHYRPGTDCGSCGRLVCSRYRRPSHLPARLRTRLGASGLNAWAYVEAAILAVALAVGSTAVAFILALLALPR